MKNIFLGLIVLLFAGCATIISGTDEKVSVESARGVARIEVDSKFQGMTPQLITFETDKDHKIRFSFPDGKVFETKLERRINKWILANILFGGIIGFGVDFATDGAYTFDTDPIVCKGQDL
ncbi:MAG: hypothetical protein JXR30_04195 [Alphaproteobacteria bacterium]|nr:hypothetical protein [Alphaproteobacteria bacterium]